METSYVITFIGDDRPGLVEQVSSAIENNRGNWHESRLSQLGGKFAGLVLVSLPADSGEALEADLKALSSSGLSVRVTPTGAAISLAGDHTDGYGPGPPWHCERNFPCPGRTPGQCGGHGQRR